LLLEKHTEVILKFHNFSDLVIHTANVTYKLQYSKETILIPECETDYGFAQSRANACFVFARPLRPSPFALRPSPFALPYDAPFRFKGSSQKVAHTSSFFPNIDAQHNTTL
jgi:hypothetical protein